MELCFHFTVLCPAPGSGVEFGALLLWVIKLTQPILFSEKLTME